jgi:hypothetical protein
MIISGAYEYGPVYAYVRTSKNVSVSVSPASTALIS